MYRRACLCFPWISAYCIITRMHNDNGTEWCVRDTRPHTCAACVYPVSRDNERQHVWLRGETKCSRDKRSRYGSPRDRTNSSSTRLARRATHLQDRGVRVTMTFTQCFVNYFRICESVSAISRAPIGAEDIPRVRILSQCNRYSITVFTAAFVYRQ